MIPALLVLMLQAAPAPVATPAAAPVCTATVAPPTGLEAWSTVSAITMGPIAVGQGTGLMLQPVDKVAFALAPGRPAKSGSFGGVYQFNIATAGTYRIALQAGAWIDVVRDGKSLESIAHTEGPACSGIRKIVDFTLAPGRYALQLSGAKEAPMRLLIVPK
ncbi:MAG: homogentisate 1,2-dioxygenase [Sphingomonas bacterium]|nr:homogentisate 1,2-dioxygenase [Sphingomonas bacterium]